MNRQALVLDESEDETSEFRERIRNLQQQQQQQRHAESTARILGGAEDSRDSTRENFGDAMMCGGGDGYLDDDAGFHLDFSDFRELSDSEHHDHNEVRAHDMSMETDTDTAQVAGAGDDVAVDQDQAPGAGKLGPHLVAKGMFVFARAQGFSSFAAEGMNGCGRILSWEHIVMSLR